MLKIFTENVKSAENVTFTNARIVIVGNHGGFHKSKRKKLLRCP